MRNSTLLLSGGIMLIGCKSNIENKTKEELPNIICLFADDMGYGDAGCYGHPTIKTPNLDRMADEGMRFTQFYVAATICSPSRGALLTGRLPVRTGMHTGVFFPHSEGGIPSEEITIAEALKEVGYATGIFGKWHLGHHEQFLPTNNGFDEYFGLPYSNDMWSQGGSKHPPLPLMEGTEIIETEPDQRLLTKKYTERTIEFIKKNQNNPFFIYLPYAMPHVPLFASENFEGKSQRGLYGDVIEEIDWSVGEVMKALKELDLDKNTLVFFTSDNGPWLVKNEEGGSAGMLKEGKYTTYDGGMREPAIAWWPGTISPGQVETSIVSSLDLFPTYMDMAKAKMNDDIVYDGESMIPLFKGETESIRDVMYYYRGAHLYAIRKGAWKLHFQTYDLPYTANQKWTDRREDPLLINVEIDPSEKYNIAEKHPEIVEELTKLAEDHQNSFEITPSVINPPK